MANYYKSGAWNVICDRCGDQKKSYELRKEWTGLRVCNACWESRHPQDLLRPPRESRPPPWTRPEPDDVFVDTDAIQTEPEPSLIFDILEQVTTVPLLIERNTGFIVREDGIRITTETGAAPLQTES